MNAAARSASPRLAVLGGGLSGLVAAWRLAQALPQAGVELFEAAAHAGGKLHTADFASGPVDVGAEAFVVRRREALDLVSELGLDHLLREPAGRRPALYIDGMLRQMPATQVFGIPAEPGELGQLCDPAVIEQVRNEPTCRFPWRPGQDANVGELVAAQLGEQVVDRLVDPMLGGVYAASARELGLRAVAPNLAVHLDRQAADGTDPGTASLVEAVRSARSTTVSGPVFGTLEGGYRMLVDALCAAASAAGVGIHLGARVRGIEPGTSGTAESGAATLLVDDGTGTIREHACDGIVCALPAPHAAEILAPVAPHTAARLGAVRCASSAVVTCVMRPGVEVPELSGVLVAADAGRAAKAMTLSSRKWNHLDRTAAGGGHVLRVSFGRLGEESALELADAEMFDLARQEMEAIAGIVPDVVEHRVTRWVHGLPVPGPGHVQTLAAAAEELVEAAVPLELAGAAINGVGVPVCIATAEAAAHRLAAQWQD